MEAPNQASQNNALERTRRVGVPATRAIVRASPCRSTRCSADAGAGRRKGLMALSLILLLTCSFTMAQPAQEGPQFSMRLDAADFDLGSPIPISVQIGPTTKKLWLMTTMLFPWKGPGVGAHLVPMVWLSAQDGDGAPITTRAPPQGRGLYPPESAYLADIKIFAPRESSSAFGLMHATI
jgi:hypothetical protein